MDDHKLRVFITDDSELIVNRLKSVLMDEDGVEVVGNSGTVHEAVNNIKSLSPDIVILDIKLPDGSGIDVLRQMDKKKGVKPLIIVYTDFPFPQIKEKSLYFGADFFIDKSTGVDAIIEIVKTNKSTITEN